MKKIIAVLVALSVSAMSVFAQEDKQIFNHLAIGPTIGFDGLGVEVATTLTPFVQIRAGYSIAIPPFVTIQGKSISAIPETIDINGVQRPLRDVTSAKLRFNFGGPKVLFDIYPGRNTVFHFTVGAYFCDRQFVGVDVDLSKTLQPDEYATYAYAFEANNPHSRISSDSNGFMHAAVVANVVRPYVGIGFGRQVRPDSRVSVSFDLGVVYTGKLKTVVYDYTYGSSGTVNENVITSAMIEKKDNEIIDMVSGIPVLPVMKLNVMIRIF